VAPNYVSVGLPRQGAKLESSRLSGILSRSAARHPAPGAGTC